MQLQEPQASEPKTRKADRTRRRIVDAAETHFAEAGFYGTSIREITRSLGMPNASLLYHFPTKERLYAAVLDRIARSLGEALERVMAAPEANSAQLRAFVDAYMDWMESHPRSARLLLRELLDNARRADTVRHWYLGHFVEAMRAFVASGQRAGVFRDHDPLVFLFHLVGSASYFHAALPTVKNLVPGATAAELRRRHREDLTRTLEEALLVAPS